MLLPVKQNVQLSPTVLWFTIIRSIFFEVMGVKTNILIIKGSNIKGKLYIYEKKT